MKPYDKLSQESQPAWEAFVQFRDLGVERGLTPVAQRLKKSVQLLHKWSKKYNWHERILAYDRDKDRVRVDAEQKAIAKAIEKSVYKQEITAQRVLNEEANLGFGRITDVISWQSVDGIVDSDKLPDEVAATIESIEFGYDTEAKERYVKKVNFHAKQPALARLGEHLKLWNTKEQNALPQQNFVQFFLEAVKSGELQKEAERRGLAPRSTIEAEVIEVKKDEGTVVQRG